MENKIKKFAEAQFDRGMLVSPFINGIGLHYLLFVCFTDTKNQLDLWEGRMSCV